MTLHTHSYTLDQQTALAELCHVSVGHKLCLQNLQLPRFFGYELRYSIVISFTQWLSTSFLCLNSVSPHFVTQATNKNINQLSSISIHRVQYSTQTIPLLPRELRLLQGQNYYLRLSEWLSPWQSKELPSNVLTTALTLSNYAKLLYLRSCFIAIIQTYLSFLVFVPSLCSKRSNF